MSNHAKHMKECSKRPIDRSTMPKAAHRASPCNPPQLIADDSDFPVTIEYAVRPFIIIDAMVHSACRFCSDSTGFRC